MPNSAKKTSVKKSKSTKSSKTSVKKKPKKTSNKKSIRGGNTCDEATYKKLFGIYTHFDVAKNLLNKSLGKKFKPFITIDDINGRMPYEDSKEDAPCFGLHIGQRKLLLSEVQFLNHNTQKYCIYPGSAPSHKTHFLSRLFPDVKFILIDPNIFEIKLVETNQIFRKSKHDDIVMLYHGFPTQSNVYGSKNKPIEKMTPKEIDGVISFIENTNHKIYIIEDYMTTKLAQILKKLGCCNFISDIRSNVTNTSPMDFDVVWNRSMVHNWISILQPEISMVKFRVPYFNEGEDFSKYGFATEAFEESKKLGIDFVEDYKNKKFRMSKATLYLQTWAGRISTEMRGWITKKNISNIVNYDYKEIEDTLFYYNKIMRVNYHENKYADKKIHFCHCNDCAIESTIWQDYINNVAKKNKDFGKEMYDINYYIQLTNKLTSRPLVVKHNMVLYEPLTCEKISEFMDMTNYSTEYGHAINRGNTGIKL